MQKDTVAPTLAPRKMRAADALGRLYLLEDLAAKKTAIYSRLLTDTSLAKIMEELSLGHEQRKALLAEWAEEDGV